MKFFDKYLRLKFPEEEDEDKFRALTRNLNYLRHILITASIIYGTFLVMDFLIFPCYFFWFFLIRLGVIFILLLTTFILIYSKSFLRRMNTVLIVLCIAAAFSISLMEYVARDDPSAGIYFFGLAQVLVFLYGFGKIPPFSVLYAGLFIAAVSISVDVCFINQQWNIAFLKSLFLLSFVFMGFFVAYIMEVNSRRAFLYRKELENLSWNDPLTGLKNRNYFYHFVLEDLDKFFQFKENFVSRSGDGNSFSVILFDVDDFKKVNDTYGHETGDQVLRKTSEKLIELSRKSDNLIRWGGEEFLLILNNVNPHHVHFTAKRILQSVTSNIIDIGEEGKISITLSGGMITVSRGEYSSLNNFTSLFELIDLAMYRSKVSGKNCIHDVVANGDDYEFKRI